MDCATGAEFHRRHGAKRVLREADLRFSHALAGLAEVLLRSQEAPAAARRLSGSSLCWQLSHHAPLPHPDRPLLQPDNRLELILTQHEQAEQCILLFAKPAFNMQFCQSHRYGGNRHFKQQVKQSCTANILRMQRRCLANLWC